MGKVQQSQPQGKHNKATQWRWSCTGLYTLRGTTLAIKVWVGGAKKHECSMRACHHLQAQQNNPAQEPHTASVNRNATMAMQAKTPHDQKCVTRWAHILTTDGSQAHRATNKLGQIWAQVEANNYIDNIRDELGPQCYMTSNTITEQLFRICTSPQLRLVVGRLKHVGWDLDYLAQLLFS